MKNYELTISTVEDEQGNKHESFGVRYGALRYDDLCFSRKRMDMLISDMNLLHLDAAHFADVVEDFIAV
ncbi:MAG: hypothetical protein GX683_01950 [Ruminococcaceae bacterium]|nr:hypothetical protein [Oscillospiraceae bacterium]